MDDIREVVSPLWRIDDDGSIWCGDFQLLPTQASELRDVSREWRRMVGCGVRFTAAGNGVRLEYDKSRQQVTIVLHRKDGELAATMSRLYFEHLLEQIKPTTPAVTQLDTNVTLCKVTHCLDCPFCPSEADFCRHPSLAVVGELSAPLVPRIDTAAAEPPTWCPLRRGSICIVLQK